MTLMTLFKPRPSAPVARERLQILLTHERAVGSRSDLIALLREEVLAAVAKHIAVDPDKVGIKLESEASVSVLEIEIEVPISPVRERADAAKAAQAGGRRPRVVVGKTR